MARSLPLLHPVALLLDPTLTNAAQTALIAVAGGCLHARDLSRFPGLAHRGRRRAAIGQLLDRGLIIRAADGTLTLSAERQRTATPLATDAAIRKLLRRRKVEVMAAWFDRPARAVLARGMPHLAAILNDSEAAWLSEVLLEIDRHEADDRKRTRRLKPGRLQFVLRRVPADYLDDAGAGPRPAPHDVRERSLSHLCRGLGTDLHRRNCRIGEVETYLAIAERQGEMPLAHWWRIVESFAYEPDPEVRWTQVRTCFAAYLCSRRLLPRSLRHEFPDRKALVREHPVPECGFGPWVLEELELFAAFQKRFGPALGPSTRELWVESHNRTHEHLERVYRGYAPGPQWTTEYERVFWRMASESADLGDEISDALERGEWDHPLVRAQRDESWTDWNQYQRRCEWRRVLRVARAEAAAVGSSARTEGRNHLGLTETRRSTDHLLVGPEVDTSSVPPAATLVQLLVRRALHEPVTNAEVQQARAAVGTQLRKYQIRHLRPRVECSVVYWSSSLENSILVPARGPAPVSQIVDAVGHVVERLLLSTDVPSSAPSAERRDGAARRARGFRALAQYLARRNSVTVEYESGATRASRLSDALSIAGEPQRLLEVLGGAGITAHVEWTDLAELFPTLVAEQQCIRRSDRDAPAA